MEEQLSLGLDDKEKIVKTDDQKLVTCKKCGCEKTIEEIKEQHKTCFKE